MANFRFRGRGVATIGDQASGTASPGLPAAESQLSAATPALRNVGFASWLRENVVRASIHARLIYAKPSCWQRHCQPNDFFVGTGFLRVTWLRVSSVKQHPWATLKFKAPQSDLTEDLLQQDRHMHRGY